MEIRTLGITQSTFFGMDNKARQRFQVSYMVGTFGPFSDFFQDEEFTPVNVRAKQEARRAEVEAITGQG